MLSVFICSLSINFTTAALLPLTSPPVYSYRNWGSKSEDEVTHPGTHSKTTWSVSLMEARWDGLKVALPSSWPHLFTIPWTRPANMQVKSMCSSQCPSHSCLCKQSENRLSGHLCSCHFFDQTMSSSAEPVWSSCGSTCAPQPPVLIQNRDVKSSPSVCQATDPSRTGLKQGSPTDCA